MSRNFPPMKIFRTLRSVEGWSMTKENRGSTSHSALNMPKSLKQPLDSHHQLPFSSWHSSCSPVVHGLQNVLVDVIAASLVVLQATPFPFCPCCILKAISAAEREGKTTPAQIAFSKPDPTNPGADSFWYRVSWKWSVLGLIGPGLHGPLFEYYKEDPKCLAIWMRND